jgi:hypothetical protein
VEFFIELLNIAYSLPGYVKCLTSFIGSLLLNIIQLHLYVKKDDAFEKKNICFFFYPLETVFYL